MSGYLCPVCKGRGEVEHSLHLQPAHTKHPNPQWEPWEPPVRPCAHCDGTGLRPTNQTKET